MSGDGERVVDGKLGRFVRGEGLLSHNLAHWTVATLLVVGYAYEVRSRRRTPRPITSVASMWSPPAEQTYGFIALAYFGSIPFERMKKLRESDRDMRAVAIASLQQGEARFKTKDSPNPTSSFPDTDPIGLGLPSPGDRLSYLAWKIRGHIFLDDRAWLHFYRTLALRYADKYPDITAADWDICVTHFASTAFLGGHTAPVKISLASLDIFIGALTIDALMRLRWASPPRMLRLGLNRITQVAWYIAISGFSLFSVPHLPAMLRPLQLQDKARVAEMLREAYPGVG
ncbi:hypothetical protein VTO73DRAFT_12942 [Trametes versicolor]